MAYSSGSKIFITGSTGQLGRLVIDALLSRVSADCIVAGVRSLNNPNTHSLKAMGIEVREADYTKPVLLQEAFKGVERLLLISSSDSGKRVQEHRNVIDAASMAGVGLIAYTSLLHADTSSLPIAQDHRDTEAALAASTLPCVLLRNGWYTENYAASIPAAIEHGVFLGCAGAGRIASAARKDLAEAAAVVLTSQDPAGRIYELAGDERYTLAEFADVIREESGAQVVYEDMTESDFKATLLKLGLPGELAELLSSSDACASRGALDDEGKALSDLIGRPTLPYRDVIRQTLSAS